MRGSLADRSTWSKLLLLGLMAIGTMFFFTGLGLALAASVFDLSVTEALSLFQDLESAAGREVFKLLQGFNTIGTFLAPALLGAYFFSDSPERFIGADRFARPRWFVVILILVLGLSMGVVSDLLYRFSTQIPAPSFLDSWLQDLKETQAFMTRQYQNILIMESPKQFIQLIVVMALLPAVAEEALFRGVVQPLLRARLNGHLTVWITAFLFALLHQQILAFFSIMALGAVLGYLREWSGSIWLPSLLHFVNNAAIVTMVYFFDYSYAEAQDLSGDFQWTEQLLLLALFLLSLLILSRILKGQNETKKTALD
jgi:hypothetical protein